MSVSAKFSYQKYNDANHQSESKSESKSRSISGGSFGDESSSGNFISNFLDGLKMIRGANRVAEFTGNEPIASVPGQDVIKAVGDGLASFLGISDSSAKQFDNALQAGIDSALAGSSIAEAIGDGVTSFNTPQFGISAKPIVYSDWSPAARLFGMDQDTAYSEHMVNTAHQREVADLKAAGLNPVLGISGSGSSSVSGNAAVASSSAQKAEEFPYLDILGATAGLVTTLVSKKPALGYMVSNVFKAFD